MKTHTSHRRAGAFLLAAALAGCVRPVAPAPRVQAPPKLPTPVAERLDLPAHPGGLTWQSAATGAVPGGGTMEEFVPAGETIADWTQMIATLTLPAEQDPRARLAAILDGLRAACRSYRVIRSAVHDGPDRSTELMVRCDEPNDTAYADPNVLVHRHEVIWAKTINGRAENFVVWRAWHGDTIPRDSVLESSAVRREWQDWVERVALIGGSS